MEFGIFDHLDRGGRSLDQLYDERLRLGETYDQLGFKMMLTSEHHFTSLGLAPSPSVFHAALIQRTEKLLMGPLVYLLPLHNPIRLIWEICMLDQMSRGRFQLGVGRGITVLEHGFHNVNPMHAAAISQEAQEIILAGLANKRLNYQGRFHNFTDVPMELEPYQKPHPPLWAGTNGPASAAARARQGFHVVTQGPLGRCRETLDGFKEAFRDEFGPDKPMAYAGITRLIVVAPKSEEAWALARRAYSNYYLSASQLYRHFLTTPTNFPAEFEGQLERDGVIAGTPEEVREEVARHMAESGANLFIARFAWGDLTYEQSLRSTELFAREVVPYCQETAAAMA